MLSCVFLLISCGKDSGEEEKKETIIDQSVEQTQNEFAWELFEEVSEEEDGNIFISPYSVFIALAMTVNGAEAETKEEMLQALGVDNFSLQQLNEDNERLMESLEKATEKITLQSANAIWLNDLYTLEKKFQHHVKTYYSANVEEVDITDAATADLINTWVKEQTNEKIEEIVEAPLDEQLVLMLTNAVYFDGDWQYEFAEEWTVDAPFYGKEETEVAMMSLEEDLSYKEEESFEMVQLPYGEGEMSMYVLLPKEGTTLQEVQDGLSYESFSSVRKEMKPKKGTVELPKFSLTEEYELNDALIRLGMEKAFDHEHANFSNMTTSDDPLWIDFVQHKTFLEVNEQGTEAAAVTNVGIKTMSAEDSDTFYMQMNRPFQFFIMEEETEAILFIGEIQSLAK